MKFSNFSSLTVQRSFPGTQNSNPNFEIQSAVVTKCSPLTVFQIKFSNLICSLTVNLKPFRSPFPELQTAISIFDNVKCLQHQVLQTKFGSSILLYKYGCLEIVLSTANLNFEILFWKSGHGEHYVSTVY